MWPLLVTLLVSPSVQAGGHWPTLAAALGEHRVPVPASINASGRITSFSTFDDERWFAIAYYDIVSDGLLHDLQVRLFDKRHGTWRSTTRDGIGSVLSIHRSQRLFYVEGHASPSATPLLVLDERLAEKKALDGWPKFFLPDGRLIFSRSMIHFAPTHAEVLAIYDPATNREQTFYPQHVKNDRGGEQGTGGLWVDRYFGDVRRGARAGTVEFVATSQSMRLTESQRPEAVGPEIRRRVTCVVAAPVPVCREAPARTPPVATAPRAPAPARH
jgi:hypothetical protein